jgi:hypothetical protein
MNSGVMKRAGLAFRHRLAAFAAVLARSSDDLVMFCHCADEASATDCR